MHKHRISYGRRFSIDMVSVRKREEYVAVRNAARDKQELAEKHAEAEFKALAKELKPESTQS